MIAVLVRVFIVQESLYLFLVWNLFLAGLPYTFAKLSARRKLAKGLGIGVLIYMGLWLLFLPNSFYIITDLIHLRGSKWHLIYFDLLVITSFAITGLMYGYYSIQIIANMMVTHLSKRYINIATFTVYFLCGFGIYLGRVLRWNSWDLLTNPMQLFNDIGAMILEPKAHLIPWAMTLGFAVFLFTIHLVMQRYTTVTKHNHV